MTHPILFEITCIFDLLEFICPAAFVAKRLIWWFWIFILDWNWSGKYMRLLFKFRDYIHFTCVIRTCVLYYRLVTTDNKISVHLVVAKYKVSLLKKLSIPHLEYCVLYSALATSVLLVYRTKIDHVHLLGVTS